MNKQCTKCKHILQYTAFGKKSRSKDGLQSQCKSCIKLYNNRYKHINKHTTKITVQRYYTNNKSKIKLNYAEYMKIPEHRIKELERQKHKQRKRRAMKCHINEHYTNEDELYTRILFDNCCANCGSTDSLCIDHHQPLSKGNALTKQNAVLLCNKCNASKRDKLPSIFYTVDMLINIEEKLGILPE